MRVIVHVVGNAAQRPSRVFKEARSALQLGLADRILVLAIPGRGLPEREEVFPGVEVWRIPLVTMALPRILPFQVVKYLEWRMRLRAVCASVRPILLHLHGLLTLGAGVAAARCPVLYDAHELETDQGQRGLRQMWDRWRERRLIRAPDAVIVVSQGIAEWYRDRYEIPAPAVVRNVPDVRMQRSPVEPHPLRARCGIGEQDMVFLYQGLLARGRRIEQLLRVFPRVPGRRHLVFMGYGPLADSIRAQARQSPNVHLVDAVPPDMVLSYTQDADVGVVGVENSCLSYFYSLPNKLFEYMLAGCPVLAPNWPEIRRTVQEHGAGWIIDESDEALLQAMSRLTREECRDVRARLDGISSVVSWEREEAALARVYRQLLDGGA